MSFPHELLQNASFLDSIQYNALLYNLVNFSCGPTFSICFSRKKNFQFELFLSICWNSGIFEYVVF